MEIDIKNFNADLVRKLLLDYYKNELQLMAYKIIEESKSGKTQLIVRHELSFDTKELLRIKGFVIDIAPPHIVGKEGIYYVIRW